MRFLKKIINKLESLSGSHKKLQAIEHAVYDDRKSAKINLGQLQATANNNKKEIHSLSELEFQVFSQFGDDGIIQWLANRLQLPYKTFIEFGVENYQEANTRFLLINNYWSGLVIDGSKKNINTIRTDQVFTFYDLQAICSFITTDNINELINSSKFAKQVGILSVDIDGNDYWVLKEINNIEPVIIICEYNSLFGFNHPYTIEYKSDFVRGMEYPFQFYGASLCSLNDLAEERGYSFIGCNSAGNNAYFIKNDFIDQLPLSKLTIAEGYNFANFTEAYDEKAGDWIRGLNKIRSIHNLPVINTRTGNKEFLDAESIINSLLTSKKINRF